MFCFPALPYTPMKQGYNVPFYVWFELCNVLGILTDTAGELTLLLFITFAYGKL